MINPMPRLIRTAEDPALQEAFAVFADQMWDLFELANADIPVELRLTTSTGQVLYLAARPAAVPGSAGNVTALRHVLEMILLTPGLHPEAVILARHGLTLTAGDATARLTVEPSRPERESYRWPKWSLRFGAQGSDPESEE